MDNLPAAETASTANRATNDRGVYPAWIEFLPRDFRVTVTFESSREAALGSKCPGVFTLSADVRNFGSGLRHRLYQYRSSQS